MTPTHTNTNTNTDTRQARIRERRAERITWLNEYLSSQKCEICGWPVKHLARWHHRDPLQNYAEPARNLSHVRYLARHASAISTIESALADLIPLCGACAVDMRLTVYMPRMPKITPRLPDDNPLRDKMRARRTERREWLANKLDQPCETCHRTADETIIGWYARDPAQVQRRSSDNLFTIRAAVNAGRSYTYLDAQYAALIPLCDICLEQHAPQLFTE